MRCLVTGGGGFVGSNLCKTLVERGHSVAALDSFVTGRMNNLEGVACDVVYSTDVRYYLGDLGAFDVIFHMAALARIQPSFTNPLETIEVNSLGTLNVLEYARTHGGSKVVYAGSSTFYNGEFSSPYCYSKHAGEKHCQLYSELYRVPTSVARFFNVYGPNQIEEGDFSTVIGIFEKCLREERPLPVVGDGKQRRDFTHVYDIVDGLIAIAEKDRSDEAIWGGSTVFNFGTGRNHSILEVAEMFHYKVEFIPTRRNEAQSTLADISLAQQLLGYEPKVRLEDYVASLPGRAR